MFLKQVYGLAITQVSPFVCHRKFQKQSGFIINCLNIDYTREAMNTKQKDSLTLVQLQLQIKIQDKH